MMHLHLYIGNKRYSSWSMRPWLLLKVKDIPFVEHLSPFDHTTNHQHFWQFSPTKKVPVIKYTSDESEPDADVFVVWDSLAIMEFVADLYPNKSCWPTDLMLRAQARAMANEMHSGFSDLRNECPMNMCRQASQIELSAAAQNDIKRVEQLWSDCLAQHGGPFLFGQFGIVDAMFAPVVNRLEVYGVPVNDSTQRYMHSIKSLHAWQAWDEAAQEEPWVCEEVEI